jgi:hypothetical protein
MIASPYAASFIVAEVGSAPPQAARIAVVHDLVEPSDRPQWILNRKVDTQSATYESRASFRQPQGKEAQRSM